MQMQIREPNPYRPGAGHSPPYLAGRQKEREEFRRLLNQTTILENVIITGIHGIGKTSFLRNCLKPDATKAGWLWVENDISESASVSEGNLLKRILADLGVKIGGMTAIREEVPGTGFFDSSNTTETKADYEFLSRVAERTPGLASDKLKAVLTLVWKILHQQENGAKGIVFAYDEAQNISNQEKREEFPLSMLLDVFSSLQNQGIPYMLVLAGLPPLFPKLVKARAFAERMFRSIQLDNLTPEEAEDAMLKPLEGAGDRIRKFFEASSQAIYKFTHGYPYFIQYCCRALYEQVAVSHTQDENIVDRIQSKLGADFFDDRWEQITDRERDLLRVVASSLSEDRDEFTVQQVSNLPSDAAIKKFSSSQANQMLITLSGKGMIFKNRHGKYLLAVPMLAKYIRQQYQR